MMRADKILCVFFSILVLTAVGVSAEGNAGLEAEMNYRSNTIEITYTSPLAYPAYITAIMTRPEVTAPSVADYLGIGQEMCLENNSVSISLPVGKDIADGTYKIFAYASGYDAERGPAQTEVTIIGSSSDDILKLVNAAGENGIAALIYSQAGEALQLEDGGNAAKLDSYIYAIRQTDFGGDFDNLTDLKEAWDHARLLRSLSAMPQNEMPEFIAAHNDVFGLDLTQEDYIAQTREVCRIIQMQCGKPDHIGCVTDLRNTFPEIIAVAMINKSPVAEKDTYFKKYAGTLGISDLMSRYAKLDAAKVARQFDGNAYNSAAEIKDRMAYVIGNLEKGDSHTNNDSGGSNRPSGGGSGGGSGWPSTEVSGQEQTETPVEQALFSDVSRAHWAWESIRALKTIQVIDGYGDGSFRPDDEVTREEFVKLIAAAFEISADNAVCDFADVTEDDWFYPYVAAVTAQGIVNGTGDGRFGAGELISRQDAAVILDRLLIHFGVMNVEASGGRQFGDAGAIADYAVQSVGRLTEAEIINGIDGNFEPVQPVSRAQAAKLIYGCMKYRSEGGLTQ